MKAQFGLALDAGGNSKQNAQAQFFKFLCKQNTFFSGHASYLCAMNSENKINDLLDRRKAKFL